MQESYIKNLLYIIRESKLTREEWENFVSLLNSAERNLSVDEIFHILEKLLHINSNYELDDSYKFDYYSNYNIMRLANLLYRSDKNLLSRQDIEILIRYAVTYQSEHNQSDILGEGNISPEITSLFDFYFKKLNKELIPREEAINISHNLWFEIDYYIENQPGDNDESISLEIFKNIYQISENRLNDSQKIEVTFSAAYYNRLEIFRYLYSKNLETVNDKENYKIELFWRIFSVPRMNIIISEFIFDKAEKYLNPNFERIFSLEQRVSSLGIQFLIEKIPSFLYENNYITDQRFSDSKNENEKDNSDSNLAIEIIKMATFEGRPEVIQHLFNNFSKLINDQLSERKERDNLIYNFNLEKIVWGVKLEYIKLFIVNKFVIIDEEFLKIIFKEISKLGFVKNYSVISKEELCERAKLFTIATKAESYEQLTKKIDCSELDFFDFENSPIINIIKKFLEDKYIEDSEYERKKKDLEDYYVTIVKITIKDIAPFITTNTIKILSLINKQIFSLINLTEGMRPIIVNILKYIYLEKFESRISEYLSSTQLETIIEEACNKIYTQKIQQKSQYLANKVSEVRNISVGELSRNKRNSEGLFK